MHIWNRNQIRLSQSTYFIQSSRPELRTFGQICHITQQGLLHLYFGLQTIVLGNYSLLQLLQLNQLWQHILIIIDLFL